LVNSDGDSSNWLFSAKLGGLETLPQPEKPCGLPVQPALAGFPELRQGFILPNTTSQRFGRTVISSCELLEENKE